MENHTKKKKVPYYKKPESMSLEEWQTELRKQFAADQKFGVKNIGDHAVFSDFEVFNPDSGKAIKFQYGIIKAVLIFVHARISKLTGLTHASI